MKTKQNPVNKGKRRLVFEIKADPGSEVFVAGSFNDWQPTKHRLADKNGAGHFQRQVYVEPGPVEYKFVVNGVWQVDSNCPTWVPNAVGSLNSRVDVN
jgi:1,4-alpha-glucan branching enzyme